MFMKRSLRKINKYLRVKIQILLPFVGPYNIKKIKIQLNKNYKKMKAAAYSGSGVIIV